MEVGLFTFFMAWATCAKKDGTYSAPVSDIDGEPCPWPFDPLLLIGRPIGMYHCPYCGSMVMGGTPHVDYKELVS